MRLSSPRTPPPSPGVMAVSEQAREELDALIQRHAGSLDSDDLRDLSDRLDEVADKWEVL